MSGAMHAFFQYPEQWQRLLDDRSLLPGAVEEMLRFVTPVMNFRRTAMADTELSDTTIAAGRQGRLLPRLGQPGRGRLRRTPTPSTSPATPTPTSPSAAADPTSASAPTWPGWRSA